MSSSNVGEFVGSVVTSIFKDGFTGQARKAKKRREARKRKFRTIALVGLVLLAVARIASASHYNAHAYDKTQPVVDFLQRYNIELPPNLKSFRDSLAPKTVVTPCVGDPACVDPLPAQPLAPTTTPTLTPTVTPPAESSPPVATTPTKPAKKKTVAHKKKPPVKHKKAGKSRPAKVNTGALPVNGDSIFTAAMRKYGLPYSWGGGNGHGATYGTDQGRNTVGFDCSGLTHYALSQAGIFPATPKTNAQMQWESPLGHYIPRKDLRAGDLVFFGKAVGRVKVNGRWITKFAVHHVGIYDGVSKFLNAPHTGATITLTPLDGYPGYVGGKRFTKVPGIPVKK